MIVGVMGTALISPLYPLYKAEWQLMPSDVTLIYVIYMLGALCSLLFLGRLPDRLSFRTMLLSGLGLMLVATLLTLIAKNMLVLALGRFLVGVASSIITTSGSLGLARLTPPEMKHRAGVLTGFLLAFGFGLGPLLGGSMAEWAPQPLTTTYLPTLGLGLVALAALLAIRLPENSGPSAQQQLSVLDFMPKLTWTSADKSTRFLLACGFPFLAFGLFGLYAAMSPLFLKQIIAWNGPFVSGTSIGAILIASALVQLASARLATRQSALLGLVSIAVSNGLLLINLSFGSSILFFLGVVFTAIGHGMSLLASMNMVNMVATVQNRSGLLSTYLLIGYAGSILPLLGMGWIADGFGINAAVSVFCGIVIVLSLVWALAFALYRK